MGNNFTTTPASGGASAGMTIDQAVAFLRAVSRNGVDTSKYPAATVEYAIQGVGNDFRTRTQSTRTSGDLALAAGVSAVPSLSGLTGFLPAYLLRATLIGIPTTAADGDDPTLKIVDYATVLNLLTNEARTGQPCLIGFDSNTTAAIYPTTDVAYTLRLLYDPPFTSWTAGNGGSTVLNIPDEHMQNILRWGGVYFLQGNEPENAASMRMCWQNYLDYVARAKSMGVGTLGKQAEYRVPRRGGMVKTLRDNLYH